MVVLPLVPVMPVMWSRPEGWFQARSASRAMERRMSDTRMQGRAHSGQRRSLTYTKAPFSAASSRYWGLKAAPLQMNRVPGTTVWESQDTSRTSRVRSAWRGAASESRPFFSSSW